MKVSPDKKFIKVDRRFSDTGETWSEIIRLDAIKCIKEHRVGNQTYGNKPGRRRGYNVIFDGGQWGSFWINDAEFKTICELLGF